MITQGQLRAARSLLGWSQKELAQKAKMGVATINRAENGDIASRPLTMRIIADVLIEAGITFHSGEGDLGPGVRIRKDLVASSHNEDHSDN